MASREQLLNSVITSDQNDTAAIDSVTKSLTAELQDAKDKEDVEDKLYSLMKAIIKSVRDISDASAQDRLVQLLSNLKSIGSLNDEKYSLWAGTVWTDLPLLGSEMREAWNVTPKTATSEQWANMNAFAARCTSAGLEDFSLYGIWCFRDALETQRPLTDRETSENGKAPTTEDVPLDYGLPAALAWLEYAGTSIVQWVQQQRDYAPKVDNQPNPSKLGPLAKDAGIERLGYSTQRWQFWMQQFKEISDAKDDAGGREKTAKLAYSGLQKMESLSKGLNL